MKKIMVAVDFSENALSAALYAAKIAQKTNAGIILVNAVEPVADKIRQPISLHEKLLDQMLNDSRNDLILFSKKIKKKYPLSSITLYAEHGIAVRVLSDFINKNKPDLVIIGTKGKTGLTRIFYGSVASGLISHSVRPVLIIPKNYKGRSIDAIVLATNRFEKNRRHLNLVIELARLFSAIVYVVIFIDIDSSSAAIHKTAHRKLENYTTHLKEKYPKVRFKTSMLKGKDFELTIEEFDIKNGVDILTMFTYHKSVWQKIFGKSFTKKMLYRTWIPMLVIPAK